MKLLDKGINILEEAISNLDDDVLPGTVYLNFMILLDFRMILLQILLERKD